MDYFFDFAYDMFGNWVVTFIIGSFFAWIKRVRNRIPEVDFDGIKWRHSF